jgi:hypothetical protein
MIGDFYYSKDGSQKNSNQEQDWVVSQKLDLKIFYLSVYCSEKFIFIMLAF